MMNFPTKDSWDQSESMLNAQSVSTRLNPNAAEFVPFSLRSPSVPSNKAISANNNAAGGAGNSKLERSESSVSNASDDEAHRYWRGKLPDDITPDFKFMGEEELHGTGDISLSNLSIQDNTGYSGYLGLNSTDGPSLPQFRNLPSNPWERQSINEEQNLSNGNSRGQFYSNDQSYFNDSLNENFLLEDSEMNPVDFLASQFPGFATESLAEVYFANGCDLNSTIEMLTQLELQGDNSFNQNLTSKTVSAPNLSAMDFPALPLADRDNGLPKYAGEELQHIPNNSYHYNGKENLLQFKSITSGPTFKATDFAAAVRRVVPQDSGRWKYERNGSSDAILGTNRQSHISGSQYGVHGRTSNGDRLQSYGGSRTTPAWLETGDAVGSLYSESREEARDFARVRNVFFEQAREAYLIGNKALAKELSVKGQLCNTQMKAAHMKARDSTYQQRNPVPAHLQSYSRGQIPIIDLHGLHVNEGLQILKQELGALRSTARSTGRRIPVFIFVGTGHHTKGSRAGTPARLPIAVERHLVEEERLDFTETQPGMLRVVI